MRRSSFQPIDISISREVQSEYDNVKVVADNVGSVVTLANNIDNILTNAGNAISVSTVAANVLDVSTVAGINTEIVSIANDKAALDSLYADKVTLDSLHADKNTLDNLYADKIKLDSLYNDKVALDRLYSSITNIDNVKAHVDNIDIVATNIANVNKVGVIDTNVTSVANIDTKVTTVAGISADVTTVANNDIAITNINAQVVPNINEILLADNNAATATTQANIATTQATNASNSASAASTSESNAAASKSNAATSESNAATSAANAATSESNAATSANTAATKASNAATSESNAAASESNAAISATNAAASEINAAASANFVDDLVLGAKPSAPTTDNYGNALQIGAIYYDTSSKQLKIWNGTAWDPAAFNTSGVVSAFNGRYGNVALLSSDINNALGFTVVALTKPAVDALNVDAATVNGLNVGTSVPANAKFTDTHVVITDALQSTSTTEALSANQGNVLNSALSGHTSNTSNPHSVTKSQVGLSNVDNTSDANKPISTATQNALNTKQDVLAEGAFVIGDKTKLDGIEVGATADQTASEILTAIKTVDGSGSGLDADTLDGLDSTQFARTDIPETFSSSVTASSFIGDGSQLTGISSTSSANYISKNANYTASANDFIYCDTTPIAQVDTITVSIVADSTLYTVTINGTPLSFTSGIGATNNSIIAGLLAAVNAGAEPVTASGVSTLVITADVAGTAFTDTVTTNLSTSTTTPNNIGNFTITLPLLPSANDRVAVVDNTSSFSTNPLTIARNGQTIMGLGQDMIVDTNNISFELIYNGTDWRII